MIGVVLRTFAELARLAGERENEWRWMSGRGFIGFCEYWMGFAKTGEFWGLIINMFSFHLCILITILAYLGIIGRRRDRPG